MYNMRFLPRAVASVGVGFVAYFGTGLLIHYDNEPAFRNNAQVTACAKHLGLSATTASILPPACEKISSFFSQEYDINDQLVYVEPPSQEFTQENLDTLVSKRQLNGDRDLQIGMGVFGCVVGFALDSITEKAYELHETQREQPIDF
jgi:hypothetical protein